MPTDIKIAFRNIFRNRRRTLLTLSSIVLGTAALMNFDGYKNYVEWGLRESYIRSQLGHLQIYKKGYKASKGLNPFEYLIKNPEEIKGLIQKTLGDRLKVATSRLEINGLITKGGQSFNFIAQGVEIDGEKKISESDDGMSTGFIIRRGKQLLGNDVGVAMLGNKLCDALDVKDGDTLSIMGASATGSLNALDLTWQGCVSTISKEYDKVAVILPISDAKRFAGSDDVLKIVVMLKSTEMTNAARKDLEGLFAQLGLELEIISWHELADYYKQVMTFLGGLFMVITIIIVFVVIFSIVNTLTMSVFERVQEIGTLRAMGATGNSVIFLFILEGLMLGIIGGILGIVFGGIVGYIINAAKFLLPPPPGSASAVYLLLRLVPSSFILSFCIAFFSSFIASIYPAFKASKLKVVDALRHV